MNGKKTCGTCEHSYAPPEQPGGLYCKVHPPQYGGNLTSYQEGQPMAQTIFCDPPVRPERQGCIWYKSASVKGKKK